MEVSGQLYSPGALPLALCIVGKKRASRTGVGGFRFSEVNPEKISDIYPSVDWMRSIVQACVMKKNSYPCLVPNSIPPEYNHFIH
jgi:hypothetical protein